MKAHGQIYTTDGWESWVHECTLAERGAIKSRAYELARGRKGGPVAPLPVEWSGAGDDVLRIKRGMPAHGDRYVDRIEFEPGEIHLI